MLPTITHANYLKAPFARAHRGGAGIAVVIAGLAVVVALAAAWATASVPARGVAARHGLASVPLTARGPVSAASEAAGQHSTARSLRFRVVRWLDPLSFSGWNTTSNNRGSPWSVWR